MCIVVLCDIVLYIYYIIIYNHIYICVLKFPVVPLVCCTTRTLLHKSVRGHQGDPAKHGSFLCLLDSPASGWDEKEIIGFGVITYDGLKASHQPNHLKE